MWQKVPASVCWRAELRRSSLRKSKQCPASFLFQFEHNMWRGKHKKGTIMQQQLCPCYLICSWKLPSSSSLSASSRTNSRMLAVDSMPSSISCLMRPKGTTGASSSSDTKLKNYVSGLWDVQWALTRWPHSYMTLLQVGFVLAHRPAPDENMALQALHGTADGHDHWVDLHRYFPRGSQNKNLQENPSCLWAKCDGL